MSQQPSYPLSRGETDSRLATPQPSGELVPTAVVAPRRMGVWRVAAGVFVGNMICTLLAIVIPFCVLFALGLLAGGGRR